MDAKVLTTALDSLSVSDRVKAEVYIAALRNQDNNYVNQLEQEARLHATIQNLPNDIWITDSSFRLIAVHPNAAQRLYQKFGILAVPGSNLLTKIEDFAPQAAASWRDILCKALAGKTTQKKSTHNPNQYNKNRYQEPVIGPYYDAAGNIAGCIVLSPSYHTRSNKPWY